MSDLICINCGCPAKTARNSLGESIRVEGPAMRLVPDVDRDGEIFMATRPTYELHECNVKPIRPAA